jgi:hypothetical protein
VVDESEVSSYEDRMVTWLFRLMCHFIY